MLFSSKSNLTLSARVFVTGHKWEQFRLNVWCFRDCYWSKRLNLNECEGWMKVGKFLKWETYACSKEITLPVINFRRFYSCFSRNWRLGRIKGLWPTTGVIKDTFTRKIQQFCLPLTECASSSFSLQQTWQFLQYLNKSTKCIRTTSHSLSLSPLLHGHTAPPRGKWNIEPPFQLHTSCEGKKLVISFLLQLASSQSWDREIFKI